MGREQERHARGGERRQGVVDAIAALRIHTHRRLVEQNDPGAMQHAAGDVQPPAHASGEPLHGLLAPVGKPGAVERPVHLLREVSTGQPVQPAEHLQVLARGEHRIDGDFLRDDAKLGRGAAAVEHAIEHADLAAVQPYSAGNRFDERGLACAVRTEQRQQLTLPKFQSGAVQRLDRAEAFPRVADREDVHHGGAPWRLSRSAGGRNAPSRPVGFVGSLRRVWCGRSGIPASGGPAPADGTACQPRSFSFNRFWSALVAAFVRRFSSICARSSSCRDWCACSACSLW